MAVGDVFDLFRLDDRVAIVTGGSKGLGEAMAYGLAQAGAKTVINSRTQRDCDRVAGEIAADSGQESLGIAADVTDETAVEALFGSVMDRFGRIDVVVNSAGINIRHPVEEFPLAEWKQVIDINLTGVWLCCREAARVMKPAESGSVINVSSTLGAVGLEQRSAYSSSKSGVIGMTRTLAKEWAQSGVRCNALCPGPFLTEMNVPIANDPAMIEPIMSRVPMHRWAELDEIKGAGLFLASDASSYVTGSELYVDGGWTC
tara:strand:+ start:18073 stop:18849 length:777 start_codon:yes stop_codon:yes gene_type:complete